MKTLSFIMIAGSFLCVLVALTIKVTTVGHIVPGPMPVNWLRLTDTALLFSIAISLWNLNKKK